MLHTIYRMQHYCFRNIGSGYKDWIVSTFAGKGIQMALKEITLEYFE
jgi:hypothetical protein